MRITHGEEGAAGQVDHITYTIPHRHAMVGLKAFSLSLSLSFFLSFFLSLSLSSFYLFSS